MTTQQAPPPVHRDRELLGQTVVLIGGTAGIGLAAARLARAAGADVVLTGRDPDRLRAAAEELAPLTTAAFDATDPLRLDRFFQDLPRPVDHVLLTGGGPYYAPLADLNFDRARHDVDEHLWLTMRVARAAVGTVRPGRTLLFVGGTGGRRRGVGLSLIGALTAAMPALVANLALEIAPRARQPHRRRLRGHPPCRRGSSATTWRRAATSSGPRCPSGASSRRPTSPRSPYTS